MRKNPDANKMTDGLNNMWQAIKCCYPDMRWSLQLMLFEKWPQSQTKKYPLCSHVIPPCINLILQVSNQPSMPQIYPPDLKSSGLQIRFNEASTLSGHLKIHFCSGLYTVTYSPPPVGGGNKIKGIGNWEGNQRVEKPKPEKYRRYYTFGSTKI